MHRGPNLGGNIQSKPGLIVMISNDLQDARARAESLFKPSPTKNLSPALEKYEEAAALQREKTQRLREQRLAHQVLRG